MKRLSLVSLLLPLSLYAAPLQAGEAKVTEAQARQAAGGTWSFSVTLRHGDEGWDHYADGWQVEDASGTVLGHRTLYHPHVNEQPFTRSLAGVSVPKGSKEVFIRAHDSVHGWSKDRYRLSLP